MPVVCRRSALVVDVADGVALVALGERESGRKRGGGAAGGDVKRWTGCSHPKGADRCLEPVYCTARRVIQKDRVKLCAACAEELDAAGMLVVGSARRVEP